MYIYIIYLCVSLMGGTFVRVEVRRQLCAVSFPPTVWVPGTEFFWFGWEAAPSPAITSSALSFSVSLLSSWSHPHGGPSSSPITDSAGGYSHVDLRMDWPAVSCVTFFTDLFKTDKEV